MKHKILIASFLLFVAFANAQLNTNLIMDSRMPSNLVDWQAKPQTITLIVSNLGGSVGKPIKIRTTIKSASGAEVSTTDLGQAKTYTFRDGNTILTAADIFPFEIQRFTGTYQKSLNKAGKLPSDSYTLCVELLLATDLVPQATIKCRNFFVAGVQLPICMMPANNQELDIRKAQTAIIFRWTPLVPRPQTVVNYRLQVFEILENQQPVQALRSNQPILDKIVTGQTQFIWQPQGILGFTNDTNLDSSSQRKDWDGKIMGGKQYIWSIQSLDASQNPIGVDGNGEGRSEPVVFKIFPLAPSKPTPKTGHVSLIKQ